MQPSHGRKRRRSLQTAQGLFLGKLPLEEVTEGLLSTDQNSPLLYPHHFLNLQLPRRNRLTTMSTLYPPGKPTTTEVCYKTYFLHFVSFLHGWGSLRPRLPGGCTTRETPHSCCRCRRKYTHQDHRAPFHKESSSVYLKLHTPMRPDVTHSPRCHANHSWIPCPKNFLCTSGFSLSPHQSLSLS